jgi:leucyl/phenylalanyl-tRNA--protein transferase
MRLTPSILLSAYCQGCFPMAEEDGTVCWYDPESRTIIPLESFHVSRSLAKRLRRGGFTVRCNTAFQQVMTKCAEPAPGREQTWISPELVEAYCRLHELGFAHSVESMFSRRTDASKIALVHLVERLNRSGFSLFDVQFTTEHLKRFGAVEIPRSKYKELLARALTLDVRFA